MKGAGARLHIRAAVPAAALAFAAALAAPTPVTAAWVEKPGEMLVISTISLRSWSRAFDGAGTVRPAPAASKLEASVYVQYGLDETRSLILQPTWTRFTATDQEAEGFSLLALGLRQRLWQDGADVISVQPSLRLPLASGTRADLLGQGAIEGEARLLWGHGFAFEVENPFGETFAVSGFTVLEWGPRLPEGLDGATIENDATLGFRIDDGDLVLLQALNSWPLGSEPRRKHQIQPSTVSDLGDGVSLQTGVVYTYGGDNTVEEIGAILALWLRF